MVGGGIRLWQENKHTNHYIHSVLNFVTVVTVVIIMDKEILLDKCSLSVILNSGFYDQSFSTHKKNATANEQTLKFDHMAFTKHGIFSS